MHATSTLLATGSPVTFQCEGSQLHGSLHAAGGSDLGVILLNQGPVDRGGSHRVYVKLANRLAALGVPVLRFDARGVGESEGAWDTDGGPLTVPQVYGRIQQGAWTPDALAAIEYMRHAVGVKRVVLGGLCGGAVTALFAGATHRHVAGMFVIGTPVTFSAVTGRMAQLPDFIIEREKNGYIYKMFYWESWRRFFTFKTDYMTLIRLFAEVIARSFRRVPPPEATQDADEKVNLPLFAAIRAAAQAGKRLLFVYGENDYLWQEFKEQNWRLKSESERGLFDMVTIPHANHVLTEETWQASMYDAATTWLEPMVGTSRARKLA